MIIQHPSPILRSVLRGIFESRYGSIAMPCICSFAGSNGTLLSEIACESGGPIIATNAWSVYSNQAKCTPTTGDDLFDTGRGDFTYSADIADYNYTTQNSNVIEIIDNALHIEYVNGLTALYGYLWETDYEAGKGELSNNLTPGKFYELEIRMKISVGGSVLGRLYGLGSDSVSWTISNNDYQSTGQKYPFIAGESTGNQNLLQILLFSATEIIDIDYMKIREIPTTDLFAVAYFSSLTPTVKANITSGFFGPCGVVSCLDDVNNPMNFVVGYFDRRNNHCYMIKWVDGDASILINVSVSYSTGAEIKLQKSGSFFKLFFKNAQVGDDQEIPNMNGMYHGLFSTSSYNQMDNLSIEG